MGQHSNTIMTLYNAMGNNSLCKRIASEVAESQHWFNVQVRDQDVSGAAICTPTGRLGCCPSDCCDFHSVPVAVSSAQCCPFWQACSECIIMMREPGFPVTLSCCCWRGISLCSGDPPSVAATQCHRYCRLLLHHKTCRAGLPKGAALSTRHRHTMQIAAVWWAAP